MCLIHWLKMQKRVLLRFPQEQMASYMLGQLMGWWFILDKSCSVSLGLNRLLIG